MGVVTFFVNANLKKQTNNRIGYRYRPVSSVIYRTIRISAETCIGATLVQGLQ